MVQRVALPLAQLRPRRSCLLQSRHRPLHRLNATDQLRLMLDNICQHLRPPAHQVAADGVRLHPKHLPNRLHRLTLRLQQDNPPLGIRADLCYNLEQLLLSLLLGNPINKTRLIRFLLHF